MAELRPLGAPCQWPGLAVEGPVAAPRMLRGPVTVRAKGEYARATTCRCALTDVTHGQDTKKKTATNEEVTMGSNGGGRAAAVDLGRESGASRWCIRSAS